MAIIDQSLTRLRMERLDLVQLAFGDGVLGVEVEQRPAEDRVPLPDAALVGGVVARGWVGAAMRER